MAAITLVYVSFALITSAVIVTVIDSHRELTELERMEQVCESK